MLANVGVNYPSVSGPALISCIQKKGGKKAKALKKATPARLKRRITAGGQNYSLLSYSTRGLDGISEGAAAICEK